jgi:uncharacterized membrane protein
MAPRRGWPWLSLLLAVPVAASGQAPPRPDTTRASVARAVLFYSPACPHCRDLVTNGLPPILRRFGDRLLIVGIDVTTEGGQAQYQAMVRRFAVTPDRQGVPTLVIGSRVLVGSAEIPSELPGLVEQGLAVGGVDWPDLPLLRQALAERGMLAARPGAAESTAAAPAPQGEQVAGRDTAAAAAPQTAVPETAAKPAIPAPSRRAARVAGPEAAPKVAVAAAHPPAVATPPAPRALATGTAPARDTGPAAGPVVIGATEERRLRTFSLADRFLADPVGNSASVVVLLAMTAGLALVLRAMRGGSVRLPRLPGWTVPVLAVIGVGVATYLSFVEVTGARAVCGPVGDCNTVQQSAYARLLGVPIGVLGLGGYVAMAAAWAVGLMARTRLRRGAWLALWVMALVGTAFSMYLTFLEPFVIGATCAWCLSSAVIITLILLAATPSATRILRPRDAVPA